MTEKKENLGIELPLLLSRIALDSGLSLGLTAARLMQTLTRSIDAGIDKYIELMENEMKTPKEKVKVE